MTPDETLILARTAGIRLEVRGDRLHIEAPRGALTPELRDALARHKPELLSRLAPASRFVTLWPDARTGAVYTLPVAAIELALDLERRGFAQSVDAADAYHVEPTARLTPADRAVIARWRRHLAVIVSYEAPTCA